jgi:two-component system repressor protein LuxO
MAKTPQALVLVLDDDVMFHDVIAFLLAPHGYRCVCVEDWAGAQVALQKQRPDVILLDFHLGQTDGLTLVPSIKKILPNVPVVLVTGDSNVDVVVRAIQCGAFDFIAKPLDEARLLATMAKAVEHHQLLTERENTSGPGGVSGHFEGIVGASPQMRTTYGIIRNVAPTTVTVLISGESGTGKELVARAIHHRSDRNSGPFVALNMAAIPKELVESTLFGHEKGAFTGADRQHIGACEEATGGTLFLDEITEMPLELQPKLLRFLQERTFRRVGGRQDLQSDARIVAATNRNPLAEVHAGRLRLDLFYRLNVIPIPLPPLREREGDIVQLARHFVLTIAKQYRKDFTELSDSALQRLQEARWPGNVRQLYHTLERTVVLHEGSIITAEMLPHNLDQDPMSATEIYTVPLPERPKPAPVATTPAVGPGSLEAKETITPMLDLEKQAIERAIHLSGGSPARAARALGISTATIYRKIRSFGLNVDENLPQG